MMDARTVFDTPLTRLPDRDSTGHKGSYGTVLGIGGSRGMSGAMALAGRAALLAGAGLVRLAVPDPILETVAGFFPEPTFWPLPADRKGKISLDALKELPKHVESATVVFLGPGLGRSAGLDQLVPRFVRQTVKPMILDADALNALSELGPDRLGELFEQKRIHPQVVLTPHPGEFARLTGRKTPTEDQMELRIESARQFATRLSIVLVLKGHGTIITDGEYVAVNSTGNPGMATGGSGDVLTGFLAGFLASLSTQNSSVPQWTSFEIARLAVHLHGLAGDLAAQKRGEESLLASNLLEELPAAMQSFRSISLHG